MSKVMHEWKVMENFPAFLSFAHLDASLDVAPIFSADHIVLSGQVVTKLQDIQKIMTSDKTFKEKATFVSFSLKL